MESVREFIKREADLDAAIHDDKIIVESDCNRVRSSLSESIIKAYKHLFHEHKISREGLGDDSDWTVMDFGPFLVHVMSPEARSTYQLDVVPCESGGPEDLQPRSTMKQ